MRPAVVRLISRGRLHWPSSCPNLLTKTNSDNTDGITDALNPTEEQFAEPRLIEAATSPAPSAQGRIQNIMSALDKHIAGREQYDDVTLLAVQRKA
jgi:hypothetical protein